METTTTQTNNNMTTVKVYLDDGTSYKTSVNPECSYETLLKYFVNTVLNVGSGEHDLMKKCVRIEIER